MAHQDPLVFAAHPGRQQPEAGVLQAIPLFMC
jgi:hypothetical protein